MLADSGADFLDARVRHEKKMITYRVMSRERRIHIFEAKKQMQDFFAKAAQSSEPVHATFIIKGRLPAGQTSAGSRKTSAKKRKHQDANPESSVGGGCGGGGGHAGANDSADGGAAMLVDGAEDTQITSSAQVTLQGRSDELQEASVPISVTLLVSDEKLEEAKARFETITSVHIYSLQAGAVKAVSTSPGIVSTQTDLHSNPTYARAWEAADRGSKLGVMHNSQVEDILDERVKARLLKGADATKAAVYGSAAAVAAASVNKDAPPAMASKTGNIALKGAGTSAEGSEPAAPSMRKKGTLDFSKAAPPKKKETPPPPAVKKSAAEKERGQSRKGNARLISSDEDDDGSELEEAPRAGGGDEEEDEEDDTDMGPIGYADDDIDDVAVAGKAARKRTEAPCAPMNAIKGKGNAAKTKEKDQREREKAALLAMMDSDEDDAGKAGADGEPVVAAASKASTSVMRGNADAEERKSSREKRRVRKQRMVKKKEKTKDAKGRTVVRNVETYESYSSWESDSDNGAKSMSNKRKAAGASSSSGHRGSKSKGVEDGKADKAKDTKPFAPAPTSAPAPAPAAPPSKPKAPAPVPAPASASAAGRKQSGGGADAAGGTGSNNNSNKPGQQSLMSFFGKQKKA
ncbi:hypothetical protein K437DRAFT_258561 [Tilletiaria anomala UBC 951]|uniref:DNA polymerase delta subunit 3 n=1 Tax=Tilletiaria anomala (strain ATCC 24038 / CBS 436.72 / UBC 951) TaxID=1037660 RepID=A0A066VPI7_TILAU|nr:uncharacterized protein K437DRAFT_258561 [Tilletiaria anomala UBC 951]KDN40694.1 hypothetical protein K437DRAFT_258561 [Tilletiaria anomala UBC 951]